MAVRLAPTMTMSDMGDSVYGPAAKGRDHPIMLPDAALPQTASRRSAGTRSSAVQGEARPAENGASAGAGGLGVSCCLRTARARSACAGSRWCRRRRSEEHTSELQSLMRISYAVFCLKKKKIKNKTQHT